MEISYYYDNDDYEDHFEVENLRDNWVGDIGYALFSPFDFDSFTSLDDDDDDDDDDIDDPNNETNDSDLSYDNESVESEFSNHDADDIMIDYDPDKEEYPWMLSTNQMKEINQKGLPMFVQLMSWNRIYSLNRDGDYFGTMYEKCCDYKHTLIVIKTDSGDLLGGYADTPWGESKAKNNSQGSRFFGNGRAFLFATSPDFTEEQRQGHDSKYGRNPKKDTIYFFKWSGENEFSQICDTENGCFGMGGGGSFGWFVQRDFTIGSSGHCNTFHNPPLVKNEDHSFGIVDVEVYGFISMSDRMSLSQGKPNCSSFATMNSFSSYGRQSSFCSTTSSVVSLLE